MQADFEYILYYRIGDNLFTWEQMLVLSMDGLLTEKQRYEAPLYGTL